MATASGVNQSSDAGGLSYFQKTVMLGDWWLIKAHKDFEGRRVGVAGTELMTFQERQAMRVFRSSPIVKVFDVFTIETADGICIILKGFINKERTVQNGFSPEVFRHFLFGFPPCWKEVVEKCFRGDSSATGLDSTSVTDELRIDPDATGFPILTPCKSKVGTLEDKHGVGSERVTVDNATASSRSGSERHHSSLLSPTKTKSKNDVRSPTVVDMGKTNDRKMKKGSMKESASSERVKAKRHTLTNANCSMKKSVSSEKVQAKRKTSEASLHLHSKDCKKNTDTGKKRNSRKMSKSTYEGGESHVHEERLSRDNTKRRIDFDVEETPRKQARKETDTLLSPDSLSLKRSRSGRLLVSPLEFWRNERPVYDAGRTLIGIKEDGNNKTPNKGSKSEPPRRRRKN